MSNDCWPCRNHSLLCHYRYLSIPTFSWWFKDRKATIVARTLSSHNLPIDRARKLFKPSKEAESLLDTIFKNSVSFGFELFLVWRHNWGRPGYFWMTSSGPVKKIQVENLLFHFFK